MLTPTQISALQQYFQTREKIVAVYLYGSHGRGTNNRLSDIDLAIMLEQTDSSTSKFHLDLIGIVSQLLQTDNLDVQILSPQTAPAIAISMLKGQLVYCKNVQEKNIITAQILSRYQDFQPFLQVQFEELENRFQKGNYAGR